MAQRLTATVTGRVQGVGFRWFVQRAACSMQLTGYVRNLPDGGVEVVAEGEAPALQRLLDGLRQGPPGARIDRVEDIWHNDMEGFTSFEIRHRPENAVNRDGARS
ncbi:MAG: acylphosphatase [Candidatus Edwardsbacteria bacterium]|jgi:acylphosphatase|nr:acylphosphatase [Candidatus Edwardsbacteria bacterium]